MVKEDIIEKLKKANLLGRGGANFPVGLKWEMVKKAKADKKYVICNGSEGEPLVFKDKYILENEPEEVVSGIKIALKTFKNSFAYIYLNKDYYDNFKEKLENLIKGLDIKLFKKPDGYICGEETTILNVIEGKRHEPRNKPPFPTQSGLWGFPTLVNNVETFYWVSKIEKGEYKGTRFYSIEGEAKNKGVFELNEKLTVKEILEKTKNTPEFDFFVQAGGGAGGEILLPKELDRLVKGAGSIIIYNRQKTDLFSLMKNWADFFMQGNCDRCVPCREGVYRLREMLEKGKIDKKLLEDIFLVMENTSFCPLGKMAVTPFRSLIDKMILGNLS